MQFFYALAKITESLFSIRWNCSDYWFWCHESIEQYAIQKPGWCKILDSTTNQCTVKSDELHICYSSTPCFSLTCKTNWDLFLDMKSQYVHLNTDCCLGDPIFLATLHKPRIAVTASFHLGIDVQGLATVAAARYQIIVFWAIWNIFSVFCHCLFSPQSLHSVSWSKNLSLHFSHL